jgi:hypothetical protein
MLGLMVGEQNRRLRDTPESEAAVGDAKCEVLLHFVLVDHRANRQPDRSGIILDGPSGDRNSDTLELTLC